MSRPKTQYQRWSNLRGYNTRHSPQALPDDIATSAVNVELREGSLGRRRPSVTAISLTSGPTVSIEQLFVHRPSTTAEELWAISGTASSLAAHRYLVASGWASVTIIDTPLVASYYHFTATTLNDKFFLAYNSDQNRLHLWDGTAVRRVGVIKPAAAPTAANGAGAGAATARRYRVVFYIISGSITVATSEASDSVSFTPAGANSVIVTRPTTPDSATHWAVFGIEGTADTYDLYEKVSGNIVVATTTYDDTTAPAAYSGAALMQLGLNIPPPSARFVVTDGNRLVMAGVHETTAATGQTTPQEGVVYFTRVLGSSDQGDDESIPNTTDQKNWVPVGKNDGDRIVGISQPVDGIIYVFKTRSIYRLTPTGIDTTPYSADRLTDAVGASLWYHPTISALAHNSIVSAEDSFGRPVVYFLGPTGVWRISTHSGVEYVGNDIASPTTGRGFSSFVGISYRDRQQIWWASLDANNNIHVYTPRLAVRTEAGWTGGWAKYTLGGYDAVQSLAVFAAEAVVGGLAAPLSGDLQSQLFAVAGGFSGVTSKAGYFGGALATDAGTAFTTSVTSKPFVLGPFGASRVTIDAPIVEGECETGATPTVALVVDHGRQTRSGTAPSLAADGSETRKAVKVEAIEAADAQVVQVTVTWDSDQTKAIDAVTIPYRVQEPL